jgi:uncharacterized cupredoxin-like copper-binding protein
MRGLRLRFTVSALGGVALVVGLVSALGAGSAPAAVKHAGGAARGTSSIITVIAGKPSELAFQLSKTSQVPIGTVTFKVTNMGVAFHNFKLCVIPVTGAAGAKNACFGKSTPTLKHGQSAVLRVAITLAGKYEFLCTIPGHAASGMKGLLGVGVPVSLSEEKAAATANAGSAGSGSTGGGGGHAGSGSGGSGDTSGCPPGTTIRTSGAADADGDELGTEPDDNDGCV